MITLLTYAPAFGAPAASPFCVKAIWLLNMASASWARQDMADPRSLPKAKLPAIRVNDELIEDSDNIRAHLEAQGHDFDAGLSDMERATSRAFIRMAEEHMYFHIVLDRWGNDDIWPIIRDQYFDMIPRAFRGFVTNRLRKTVLSGMHAQGLGRLSNIERMAKLEPDLQAITTRLWHGPFLFGDQPTAADASVAAMLQNMRATPGKTLLKTRITEDEILMRYIDRMEAAMRNPAAVTSDDATALLCA